MIKRKLIALTVAGTAFTASAQTQPNVLLIVAEDNHRAYMLDTLQEANRRIKNER